MTESKKSKPTQIDGVFQPGGPGRDGSFISDWYKEHTPEFMARSFNRAANLVSENQTEISPRGDQAMWPVGFLHRHAIELQLKEIIWRCSVLLSESYDDKRLHHHRLANLWQEAKELLARAYGERFEVQDVETVIDELNSVDPTGDGFRYWTARNGAPNLGSIPRGSSIEGFSNACDKCFQWLDGLLTDINHRIECLQEQWRDQY